MTYYPELHAKSLKRNAEIRQSILSLAIQGIPELINILQNDKPETTRSVASEALADFGSNQEAYNALLQAK